MSVSVFLLAELFILVANFFEVAFHLSHFCNFFEEMVFLNS